MARSRVVIGLSLWLWAGATAGGPLGPPAGEGLAGDRRENRTREPGHPGRPTSNHLALPAAVIGEGEPVRVGWFDTPGSPQDWISVSSIELPDEAYGAWTFTGGQSEGVFVTDGLQAGEYEARLYLDWPSGGFRVVDRLRFRVVLRGPPLERPAAASKHLAVAERVFAAGSPVVVGWHDLPGRATDWITVVRTDAPAEEYGAWRYVGLRAGSFLVPALEPGAYEVRLFFDWPNGGFEIRDRLGFAVR